MAVGDVSTFSKVDTAIWSALQDTTTTDGLVLSNWRKEQTQSAGGGKDFNLKEVPRMEDIKGTETPALIAVNGTATGPGTTGADFEQVVYQRRIIGVVRSTSDEVSADAKCKKFAELVWNVLVDARQTCFGSYITGTNPIQRIDLANLIFPELLGSNSLFLFDLGMDFRLNLTNR